MRSKKGWSVEALRKHVLDLPQADSVVLLLQIDRKVVTRRLALAEIKVPKPALCYHSQRCKQTNT